MIKIDQSLEGAEPGLRNHRVTREGRRTTVTLLTAQPNDKGETRVELLAAGLAHELHLLRKQLLGEKIYGLRVPPASERDKKEAPLAARLRPVLRAYGEILQRDQEWNLSLVLAELAWRVADGNITPGAALSLAKRVRKQRSWEIPATIGDAGPVGVAHVEAVVGRGKRGPSRDRLTKVVLAYRVLAWDSSAEVQPTARSDKRSEKLNDLLEASRQDWELVRSNETERNESDS